VLHYMLYYIHKVLHLVIPKLFKRDCCECIGNSLRNVSAGFGSLLILFTSYAP
jgi:hypothetical protein